MTTAELLPWHQDAFRHVMSLHEAACLPHAWLLDGPAGGGKRHFAHYLAVTLLCEQPTATGPCTHCHACRLTAAGSHPDLYEVTLLENSRAIRIDQVREAVDFMNKTSNQGGLRVLILHPAEAMNINAANALLKTLEEPPSGVVLLLIANQPGLVLPTVRSRSRRLALELPAHEAALEWLSARTGQSDAGHLLAMAEGAPLKALHYDDESWRTLYLSLQAQLQSLAEGRGTPVEAAEKLYNESSDAMLEMVLATVRDLLRHIQSGGRIALRDGGLAALTALVGRNVQSLHGFYATALGARRALIRNSNPNPRLMLEALFANWQAVSSRSREWENAS